MGQTFRTPSKNLTENQPSIECSHQDALVTVSWPRLAEKGKIVTTTICRDCFRGRECEEAILLGLGPLEPEKTCSDCNAKPARRSGFMYLCNKCRSNQNNEFERRSNRTSTVEPNEIIEGRIFLGSEASAANRAFLDAHEITAVLVCGSGLGLFYANEPGNVIKYHQLPIEDTIHQPLLPFLPASMKFISCSLAEGRNVLIHCHAGVSRSASVMIAWIMLNQQLPFDQALEVVYSKRPVVAPNGRFRSELEYEWWPYCIRQAKEATSGGAKEEKQKEIVIEADVK